MAAWKPLTEEFIYSQISHQSSMAFRSLLSIPLFHSTSVAGSRYQFPPPLSGSITTTIQPLWLWGSAFSWTAPILSQPLALYWSVLQSIDLVLTKYKTLTKMDLMSHAWCTNWVNPWQILDINPTPRPSSRWDGWTIQKSPSSTSTCEVRLWSPISRLPENVTPVKILHA